MADDDMMMLGGSVQSKKQLAKEQKRIEDYKAKLAEKKPVDRTNFTTGEMLLNTQKEAYRDPEGKEQGHTPYFELLNRGYEKMNNNNPNMRSRKKCRILPPIVTPSGSKRTLYANVQETAAQLHRDFEHLKDFIYVELATTGSVDGDGRLLLRGRFRVPQIQSVLTSYARQYVICANCGSPNTKLNRDPANRLWFLKCSNCQSQRAVTTVRTGFRATMRGQRRAARNAATQ